MANKRYNAKYNSGSATPPKEMARGKRASVPGEGKRKLPSMGPKRPGYESSAPKIKTYVRGDY